MGIYSVITATGSYTPEKVVRGNDFLKSSFLTEKGEEIRNDDGSLKDNREIIDKFVEITGIKERRHAWPLETASELAYIAAKDALDSSDVDKESIDQIILAHNFGDIDLEHKQADILPTLATRVKNRLEIENGCPAHDTSYGCPGWVKAMREADNLIYRGDANKVLVIATDTLSRVSDPYDRDSMIYADGAGAAILERKESDEPIGIISYAARTDAAGKIATLLKMGESYLKKGDQDTKNRLFLKMDGNNVFKYALKKVPGVVRESLDKANLHIKDINKVLIHQANEKLDQGVLKNLCRLYKTKYDPDIMPMTISKLGNTSAATVPILLDLILKGDPENLMNGELKKHKINPGDNIVFASVGAGMSINSIVYKVPN